MAQYLVDLKDLTRRSRSKAHSSRASIDFGGENLRQIGPLVWSATAERAGEEIRIAGTCRRRWN